MGKLDLDHYVFGPDGYLGTKYGSGNYSPNVTSIRLHNLLEHTGGWGAGLNNPEILGVPIAYDMSKPDFAGFILDYFQPTGAPDTYWLYSNVNYFFIGLVVEEATGMSYEDAVRELVYDPVGIYGGPKFETGDFMQRDPEAAVFYSPAETVFEPEIFLLYNGPRYEHLLPAGGWLMSSVDLLRFMVSCRNPWFRLWIALCAMFQAYMDGFPKRPDIITPLSIKRMLTPSKASVDAYNQDPDRLFYGYGLGWQVGYMKLNETHNWPGYAHLGTLFGKA